MENNAQAEEKVQFIKFGPVVSAHYDKIEERLTIKVIGDFVFKIQQYFRDCYTAYAYEELKEVVIDLNECVYLDSSGLGMILLMKESANFRMSKIRISSEVEQVKDLLEISNFNKFGFIIE